MAPAAAGRLINVSDDAAGAFPNKIRVHDGSSILPIADPDRRAANVAGNVRLGFGLGLGRRVRAFHLG
jgi:hypothetical protein